MIRNNILLSIARLVVGCTIAFGLNGVVSANAQSLQDTTRLIVKFKSAAGIASGTSVAPLAAAQMQGIIAAAGVNLGYIRPMSTGAHVVSLPAAMTQAAAAAIADSIMQNDPAVQYAEPDARMYPQLVPNDPSYASQWHYDVSANHGMNLPGAWDITTGSATTVAAVIDTGILTHADLDPARVLPGYDMISNLAVANDGDLRDPYADDPGDWITVTENTGGGDPIFTGCTVSNSSWHGTHVAGTIGANTNNGVGVAGVNWSTKILPVRVLGKCGGFTSDIVDGMNWAAGIAVAGVPANPNPADVLNLSLGGSGACSVTYQTAIDAIVAAGTTVVVSAGNSGLDASGFQPASCNNVITVAAHGNTSTRAYYSNFGNTVEIMAPGGAQAFANDPAGVLSTLDGGTTVPLNDNAYIYYQGTSMAAPHITGLVTLLLAANSTLTPAQISTVIQDSSRAFVPGSDCALNPNKCGAGIADAQAAVAMVLTPTTPTTLAGAPASSTQIDLTWVDAATNETAYKIERKTGAGGIYAQIGTAAANATTYTDATAVAETDYFYRVRASSSYADSLYSNEANVMALAAPSALATTSVAETQVDLSWTDNSAIETGFKIERKVGAGAYTQIGTVAANVVAFSDPYTSAGVSYTYKVLAYNAQGSSSYSNSLAVTTPGGVAAGGGGGGGCLIGSPQMNLYPLLMLVMMLSLVHLMRRKGAKRDH